VFTMGSQCSMDLANCNADMDCAAWVMCTSACNSGNPTAECYAACDQAASAVMNLFQPIYDCVCAACKAECGAACP